MLIHLIQYIQTKDDTIPHPIYKYFDSDIIPHKGDYICDSVWSDTTQYKVDEVIIDYASNRCTVTVEKCVEEWDTFAAFLNMAKLHNWTDHFEM